MRPRLPQRQALLLSAAILAPCLVLVALGLRLMAQERQLDAQRRAERRQMLIVQARQELLSALEQLKLQEVTRVVTSNGMSAGRSQPGLVPFVGSAEGGRVRLPWEQDSRADHFRAAVNAAGFASAIRRATSAELIARDLANAVLQYKAAISAARDPVQQIYGSLLLARALGKQGRAAESHAVDLEVLGSPAEIMDEYGVPLSFYAARRLLEAGELRAQVLGRLREAAADDRWLSPPALFLLRDLAARLDDSDVTGHVVALLRDTEQAEALQSYSAQLLALANRRDPVWLAFGDPAWLVGLAPRAGQLEALVVAVRATAVFETLTTAAKSVRLASARDGVTESLGEGFPGLRVTVPPDDPAADGPRQAFLAIGVFLALAITLLAGYLLWRDVRRERRLAETRSQFVSSVTHELKTPLTAIRMFAETLRLDEDVDHRTRSEYLDTILHESERLSRLVDNVLDFGKIERGKKRYRLEPVRLEDVVEGAARAVRYPFAQAGFALDVAVRRDLPQVPADADALQQAILNLLTNAMKYSGDSRRIRLGLDRRNGNAQIQVIDEGVGLSPADRARVLDQFYRVDSAENARIPGAGLGLTIVSHIAVAHGGGVEVESEPGAGSTFTISLPLPGDSPAARAGVDR